MTTSSKTNVPSHTLKRLKSISKEPQLKKKSPTLIDENTKSFENEQEFDKDESTHSSKSHDSAHKETTKSSDTLLKSSKETRKHPFNISTKLQFDRESVSNRKSDHSVKEEDIVEKEVKKTISTEA